jgi:hypothetical protein
LISIDKIRRLPDYDSEDNLATRKAKGDIIDCHEYSSSAYAIAIKSLRRNPHQADIYDLVNAGFTVILEDDGNKKEWLPFKTVPYPIPGGEFEII